ncbi:MAG: sulfite exporter TauE/SafE family protein [Proteobacteria bacterium]|nr:sulfite exporter TauE/SafE family protein [Pseudomonadota bacterium]
MSSFLIITFIAGFAYFIESIFGFGGTIIFLGISGFFIDFDLLLKVAMFLGLTSGFAILIQSFKHVSFKDLKSILLMTIPGALLGSYLIDYLQINILLNTFAIILIAYGLLNLINPDLNPHNYIKNGFIYLGGLIQGLFTIGGPFVLMGYKDKFINKQQLRSTMAAYFFIINLIRIIQYSLSGNNISFIIHQYYLTSIVIMLCVWSGYLIHTKIPEKIFKKAIIVCVTIIGILILFKTNL